MAKSGGGGTGRRGRSGGNAVSGGGLASMTNREVSENYREWRDTARQTVSKVTASNPQLSDVAYAQIGAAQRAVNEIARRNPAKGREAQRQLDDIQREYTRNNSTR